MNNTSTTKHMGDTFLRFYMNVFHKQITPGNHIGRLIFSFNVYQKYGYCENSLWGNFIFLFLELTCDKEIAH